MAQPGAVGCSDFLHRHMGRRTFLKVGGLGVAGLTLPNLLRAEETRKGPSKATAKSIILLFQFGGACVRRPCSAGTRYISASGRATR